ncbi:hypothetical protein ACFVR2_07235 [Gottfriedia sp. NPDC057991]|uniref:hypothetical protein n=1 Tax=Gottfriedia sp. NPDC057991 TaxID=3346298 RepID=UPI0036DD18D2
MMKRFATYYPYEKKLLIEGDHKLIQGDTKNVRSKEIGKKVVLVGLGISVVGLLIPTSKLFLYPEHMLIGKVYYHAIDWVHHFIAQQIHYVSSTNFSSGHYIASIDPHPKPNSSFAKDSHFILEKIDGKMKNHFEGVKDFLERNK